MTEAGQAAFPKRRSPDGSVVAAAGTIAVHVLAAVGLWLGPPESQRRQPIIYEVNLVAAPRPQAEQRRAPEAVDRPAERAVQLNRREPRRTSVSPENPPEAPVQDTEAPVRTTPEMEPAPDAEPSTGSDPGTVETSGVEFPFPGYLRNIVAQVYRRWQRPEGNVSLRAEILFFIRRDGSVTNLQFVRRSGSYLFDLEAQGAIESAANNGAFGPLPEGYPGDILPVSFFFDPESLR